MEISDDIRCVVAKAKAGDREAFGLLYNQYCRYALYFARQKFQNEQDALDFVQSLFLAIMIKLPSLRNDELFFRWFRTAMKRHFIRQLKAKIKYVRRVRSFHQDEDGESLASIDDRGAERFDLEEYINEAMAKLKTRDSRILIEYYYQGAKLAVISENWSIPLGSIKRQLHFARSRLREELCKPKPHSLALD